MGQTEPESSIPPVSADALHRQAMRRYREGDLPGAIDLMSRAVAASADSACADSSRLYNDLGTLHHAAGDLAAAAECYRRAAAAAPRDARVWLNLADTLADLGDYAAAVVAYERAIAERGAEGGQFPEALNNLAAVLLAAGQFERAKECCLAALAARPDYALAYNTLGAAWLRLGKPAEAVAACLRSCQLRPESARGWFNLGTACDEAGDRPRAAEAFRRAVALDPNLEEARYDLAALGKAPPPPRMPPRYVVRLFDNYSAGFDQHLVGRLGYRVPESLLEAVDAVRPASSGAFDRAADVGCGTGLVGRLFRPRVRFLVGVDLSPRMIELARAAGVYDELAVSDAVEFLARSPEAFDLILAADFFIYYGDAAACLAATSSRLRPGGLFAFSVETIGPTDLATDLAARPGGAAATADYVLRPTRRYAHSAAYVRRAAAAAGLSCELERQTVLRTEQDQPVAGTVFVIRQP